VGFRIFIKFDLHNHQEISLPLGDNFDVPVQDFSKDEARNNSDLTLLKAFSKD
jgi:hypothetical protein